MAAEYHLQKGRTSISRFKNCQISQEKKVDMLLYPLTIMRRQDTLRLERHRESKNFSIKFCVSFAFGLESQTSRSGLAIAGKLLTYLIFDNEKIAGEAKCIVFVEIRSSL